MLPLTTCDSFTGFGYAKALIFGEYAVMYGAPGLVAALSPKAKVTLKNPSQTNDIDPINVLGFPSFQEQFGYILQNPSFPGDVPWNADFDLDLSQFVDKTNQKLGIGSSAAAIVAVLQAKCKLRKHIGLNDVTIDEFLQTAIQCHRYFQRQMGSGFDIIASTLGGLLDVSHCPHQPEIHEIASDAIPPFAILATHQQAPTIAFISAAKSHENTKEYQRIIDALTEIYTTLQTSVIQCNKDQFLCVIPEVSHWLDELSSLLYLPVLPHSFTVLNPIAQSHGVTIKTSGAGGGDIFLAFAKTQRQIQEFTSNIPEHLGISVLPFTIAPSRQSIYDG